MATPVMTVCVLSECRRSMALASSALPGFSMIFPVGETMTVSAPGRGGWEGRVGWLEVLARCRARKRGAAGCDKESQASSTVGADGLARDAALGPE